MASQPSSMRDKINAFGNFLWNSEEKTVLGRGGRSWVEIGVFYLIYYACLAGFFVGMLAVFYQTVDEKRPKLTGDSSLLKGNPGMGFQPMPDVEYTLIRFQWEEKSYKSHLASIQKILKPYLENQLLDDPLGVPCSPGNPAPEGQACQVNISALTADCNVNNNYGYGREEQPCVLLRLNKIFGWMPVPYTADNIKESGASEELQKKILADPEMIYIDCKGENAADRDNVGEIAYYPEQGFRHFYYPFTNQGEYMSPLVFVKFLNPPKNIALMIECRALAPNIKYDRTEKEGGVHFELFYDP